MKGGCIGQGIALGVEVVKIVDCGGTEAEGGELHVFLHSAGEFFVVGASISMFVLWDELHWDAGKSPEVF